MAGPAAYENDEEQPLDPAAERVRRKLVRFMAVNLAILFVAVMAVVLALVYRTMTQPSTDAVIGPAGEQGQSVSGEVVLPDGAAIISHSLVGDRLTLHVRSADGGEAILVYETREGAHPTGRLDIVRETP